MLDRCAWGAHRISWGNTVGVLRYQNEEFAFDDRMLAHLQIVISTKLRRSENFFLSWAVPVEGGGGRHALWIDNGVPVHITYAGSRAPQINREWIEALILSSATGGVHITDDPPVASADE
jgi:hypothetical protein